MKSDFSLVPSWSKSLLPRLRTPHNTQRTTFDNGGLRAFALMLAVTGGLGLCSFRLIQLQLVRGQYHRQVADENRLRPIPIPAARGNILDRNGKPIAASKLSRSAYVWPKQQSPEAWKVTADKLSPILRMPSEEILNLIEKEGYSSNIPVKISRNLTLQAFITLAERSEEFLGLEIRGDSSRHYPNGSVASHLLGYVGEATEEDLRAHPEYPMGAIVGKMGLEHAINKQLQGQWGNRLIEVNAKGQELRELAMQPVQVGEDVNLTLDFNLQKTAENALGGRRGAAVVLDVKTGAVLALASSPTFDPNIFTRRVTAADWESLQGEDDPFLNRALQGYPTGSTFKIITAVAGIESGKYFPDSVIGTSAYITVGDTKFHEHSGGYGVIGFEDALTYSSNTFFYLIGMAIGPEEIAKWGQVLGIGKTDFDLLGVGEGSHGSIPIPEEKEALYGEPWYVGDTVSMSIGQGLTLVTPLELAVMMSTVANGGNRVKPHLVAAQTNTKATRPEKTGIDPATLEVIKDGLRGVVERGTGRALNDGSIPLTAGKTGTVEVLGREDNSMYVGYGPADDPQIAIAVVVEEGGYGSKSALPVAKQVFQTYFGKSTDEAKGEQPEDNGEPEE
ncbi:MAG: penicillin-binding protein 2 [Geitlerinemataceae cyanobacterium]